MPAWAHMQVEKQVPFEQLAPGMATLQTTLTIPDDQVQLWWPVGYGQQPLYKLTATWCSDGITIEQPSNRTRSNSTGTCGLDSGNSSSSSSSLDGLDGLDGLERAANCNSSSSSCEGVADPRGCTSMQRRVGFRTVELVREPLAAAATELLGSYSGWDDPFAGERG